MRFERISFEAFRKDMLKCKFTEETILTAYNNIKIPERQTQFSCGYDFVTPVDFTLKPNERMIIPTGIKAVFPKEQAVMWYIQLFIRSSLGVKRDVILSNNTGIIDPDYANNPENEGNILMPLHNTGYNYQHFEAGDRIAQGVISLYGIAENDTASGQRIGGVGSTDKEDK